MNSNVLAYSVNRADAMQIAAHLRACDAAFIPPLSGRVDIDEYARKLVDRAERFEAWAGECLAGLVAAYFSEDGARRVFISSVSVLPEWRGSGVASGLLERCLSRAEAFGGEPVELEVGRANAHAIRLYERFGFTAVQRQDPNVLLMTRRGGRCE